MKYLLLLLLTGCTSAPKETQTSDMPIINFCIFASCSVQSSERGAAQDVLQDSDIKAEINDKVDQKATNENEVELQ